MRRTPKYFPRRFNAYVPAMQYSASVVHEAPLEVNFGPALVSSATALLSAQSINAAIDLTSSSLLRDNVDPVVTAIADQYPYGPSPFGRNLIVIASGAATSNVTVYGRDYLGQAMVESFTLNGANSVVGLKAFKYIDRVVAGATSSTTINLGVGTKFGLPYRASNVLAEMSDGARVSTLGTFVAGVTTDPQTTTAGDPRGTYIPNTTPDGAKYISAVILLNSGLNASGNGGLHGIQHVAA
jgi:hypothetical protein